MKVQHPGLAQYDPGWRVSIVRLEAGPCRFSDSGHSQTQPREFYIDAHEYIPNAKDVTVRHVDAGHFWSVEAPDELTDHLRDFLNS